MYVKLLTLRAYPFIQPEIQQSEYSCSISVPLTVHSQKELTNPTCQRITCLMGMFMSPRIVKSLVTAVYYKNNNSFLVIKHLMSEGARGNKRKPNSAIKKKAKCAIKAYPVNICKLKQCWEIYFVAISNEIVCMREKGMSACFQAPSLLSTLVLIHIIFVW